MSKFIIKDWESNTLQFDGKFNFGAYDNELGVPMVFDSCDDAWEWIYMNIPLLEEDESYDDLFVEVKS